MTKELKIRFALFAVAALSLLWGYQTMFLHHAPDMFRSPEEDMSYAWYVPLFSLYVVWTERKRFLDAIAAPSWSGAALLVPAFFIGFLGVRGTQLRLEILGFVLMTVALVWTVFGRRAAARIAFPAGFLCFCMPFNTYLDTVTVHLRLFATSVASGILEAFGAGIVRTGTSLIAADGSFGIDVAAPCSGLRSIFALMALTAGYAYFNQKTWLKRAALFALSVPIAVIGNIARVLSIAVVGMVFSGDFATGFYHDYSGYVVFLVAIALMLACSAALAKIGGRGTEDGVERLDGRQGQQAYNSKNLPPLNVQRSTFNVQLSTLLLLAAMIWQAKTPETVLMPEPSVTLPELAAAETEELEMSEAERTTLPADTKIRRRRYHLRNGSVIQVSAVIGGRSKSSVHRPELCLPGQGYRMSSPRTLSVGGVDWRTLVLERGGEGRTRFAYTFANGTGFRTSSHLVRIFADVWDRSLKGRIDRWVMITVSAPDSEDATFARILESLGDVVK